MPLSSSLSWFYSRPVDVSMFSNGPWRGHDPWGLPYLRAGTSQKNTVEILLFLVSEVAFRLRRVAGNKAKVSTGVITFQIIQIRSIYVFHTTFYWLYCPSLLVLTGLLLCSTYQNRSWSETCKLYPFIAVDWVIMHTCPNRHVGCYSSVLPRVETRKNVWSQRIIGSKFVNMEVWLILVEDRVHLKIYTGRRSNVLEPSWQFGQSLWLDL